MRVGCGSDEPHAAADQEHGRGDLASARSPLVIPHRSEAVLQVVVGAGDVRSRVAHEQTWPVAARHLQEVAHRRLERTDGLGALAYLREEASVRPPDQQDVSFRRVVQPMCSLVQPTEGHADRRPQCGGGG